MVFSLDIKVLSTRGKKMVFAKAVFYLPSVTNQVALVIVCGTSCFLLHSDWLQAYSVYAASLRYPGFDSPKTAIPLLALDMHLWAGTAVISVYGSH